MARDNARSAPWWRWCVRVLLVACALAVLVVGVANVVTVATTRDRVVTVEGAASALAGDPADAVVVLGASVYARWYAERHPGRSAGGGLRFVQGRCGPGYHRQRRQPHLPLQRVRRHEGVLCGIGRAERGCLRGPRGQHHLRVDVAGTARVRGRAHRRGHPGLPSVPGHVRRRLPGHAGVGRALRQGGLRPTSGPTASARCSPARRTSTRRFFRCR